MSFPLTPYRLTLSDHRTALLKHFGSVRKLRAADVDEIAAVPGFGRRTAVAVLTALHGSAGDPANDTPGTEGER